MAVKKKKRLKVKKKKKDEVDKLFIRYPMTVSATVSTKARKSTIEKALVKNAIEQIHEYVYGTL